MAAAAEGEAAACAEVEVEDRKGGQRYLQGRLLGKGGFARCYKFRHAGTRHVCAGKCVEKASLKKDRARRKLLSEIKIHRALSHPNVVRFEHFFEDKRFVYILLEYCNNQTLMELVKRKKRLSEALAKEIMLQLLDGVAYLQSQNVIHRDLKLGNIFLTNGYHVRIGDFGLATKLEHADERKKTMCGTPNYIAPEILDGKLGHSFEVDIWSLGVILYTMLVGKPPFETKNVKQTYKRIQANLYSFPAHLEISVEAKSLIRAILNKDPAMRPNLDAIRAHPFLRDAVPMAHSPTGLSDHVSQMAGLGLASDPPLDPRAPVRHSVGPSCAANRPRSPAPSQSPGSGVTIDKENAPAKANLSMPPSSSPRTRLPDTKDLGPIAEIFVDKWVDYTSKYGLGYMLRSGAVGVYLNDSSKLVLAPNGHLFQYYERAAASCVSHTLTDYPADLHKKVTLLKHFRAYLLRSDSDPAPLFTKEPPPQPSPAHTAQAAALSTTPPLPFVKKWVRTRHAMFFRLSNRTVQVAFFDHTQVLLSAQAKRLLFLDKHGNAKTILIADAKAYPEISKRLKYTKEVLHQLIAGSPSPVPSAAKE